jgi:hypothetical protein
MKKITTVIAAAFAVFTATLFTSCDDKTSYDDKPKVGKTKSVYIDATSNTAWHYYSLQNGQLVGSADESTDNNAVWSARQDWDIAIRRYNIRTNSGAFTTASAKGGVFAFDGNTTFESVNKVPTDALFEVDTAITSSGMGGTTTIVRSEATVIVFEKNPDGSLVMPPVYLQAPVYVFRTAGGNNYYKVQFTQYVNDTGATGHVAFDMAEIGL